MLVCHLAPRTREACQGPPVQAPAVRASTDPLMQRKTMTRAEFQAVHPDYRMRSAYGGHYVLENTDRGTALVPVEIVG